MEESMIDKEKAKKNNGEIPKRYQFLFKEGIK